MKRVYVALFIILVSAFAIRLFFFTGMVRGDDFNYAHAAYELSIGRLDIESWAGNTRIGLYGPVALLYWIFGPSEITTLVFPMFASMLSIIFVFLIARMYGGIASGLIAATLWAFFSLDVHLATQLLPDGPLAAFSTGGVFFLLLAKRSARWKKGFFYLLSFSLLLWAILIKPLALITLIFFLFHFLVTAWKKWGKIVRAGVENNIFLVKILLIVGIVILTFFAVAYARIQTRPILITLARTANNLGDFLFIGTTELDFSDLRFFQADLLVHIAPLFLVAVLFAIVKERRDLKDLLIWLAVIYLYYEWGTIRTALVVYSPIEIFTETRNMLFIFAPFIILVGIYLGKKLIWRATMFVFPVIAIVATIVAVIVKPILYSGIVPEWMQASAAIVVFGAFVSPIIMLPKSNRLQKVMIPVYLFAISLAALEPVLPNHALMFIDRQDTLNSLRDTMEFWADNPSGQIYVSNKSVAMRLNYASDFQLGFDWGGVGLKADNFRILAELPVLQDGAIGYTMISGDGGNFPNNWLVEKEYVSALGKQLAIYRISPLSSGEEK